MNPNSGHLIALKDSASMPAEYEPIPDKLLAAARDELAGRSETHVNLRGNTPLALWAKKKRKAKLAAASRRRNRK